MTNPATKAQALAVAKRLGFALDPVNSGRAGDWFLITLDHAQSLGGDCRSIHVEDPSAAVAWGEAIERMESEAPFLEPCADDDCEYHGKAS